MEERELWEANVLNSLNPSTGYVANLRNEDLSGGREGRGQFVEVENNAAYSF